MESKDLRIENKLQKDNGEVFTVLRIDNTGDVLVSEERSLLTLGYNLKAIPLTEEHLKQLGFKRETKDDKYGRVWLHKNFGNFFLRRLNYNRPIFDKPDYGYALELSDDNNWITVYRRVMFYYELQNLFFTLTGKELK